MFHSLPATQPSVSSFPLLLTLSNSDFISVRLNFHLVVFLFPFDLISHVFVSDSCTWLPVRFLSLFPDSLPQLFLRWSLKISLLGQILDFHFLSSVSVLEPHYSAFCFFRSLLPDSISQWFPSVLRFFLSALPFSPFSSAWFLMLSFMVSILGSLFVSFRPSRFHSHSCFTGASLCPLPCVRFFVGIFCLLSTFFRPFQSASNYSAFWPFFSLLFDFPCQRLSRCIFHLLYSLFPCFPSDSGTQLTAIPFTDHCFVSQWLLQCLSFSFRTSADSPWLTL